MTKSTDYTIAPSPSDTEDRFETLTNERVINPGEIVIGAIQDITAEGTYVNFEGNPVDSHLLAISTIPI